MIGLANYDNPQKQSWRGWWWNQIVAHMPEFSGRRVPQKGSSQAKRVLKDKTVLYLCGPRDFDRDKALEWGFSDTNLFAVDIQGRNVASVRRSGGIAVQCDIQDLVAEWPASFKLDVISFDSCSVVSGRMLRFAVSLPSCCAVGDDTVIGLNLQRGRDSQWSRLSRSSCANRKYISVRGMAFLNERVLFPHQESLTESWVIRQLGDKKNRAKQFLYAWIALAAAGRNGGSNIFDLENVAKAADPKFYSYRSSRVVMDSVVFTSQMASATNIEILNRKSQTNVRRKITALRAVRTMRRRA